MYHYVMRENDVFDVFDVTEINTNTVRDVIIFFYNSIQYKNVYIIVFKTKTVVRDIFHKEVSSVTGTGLV